MYAIGIAQGQVCVKIPYKGYEISLAFDDSCQGIGRNMFRSYLRVFKDDVDVTNQFFYEDEVCGVQENDLPKVYKMIDAKE